MSVNEKMTAIADAIRDKTGGTEALTLDDMAAEIPKVFEEGKQAEYDAFWDALQDYGNKEGRNYHYKFCYNLCDDRTFNPKYPIICSEANTSASNMFYYNTLITDTKVPIIVLGTNIAGFAYRAYRLVTIRELNLNKNTKFNANSFQNCTALENFNVTGTIGQNGFNVQWSTKLNKASIESIINALSAKESGLTVTLSQTAVNNAFTAEEWEALEATKTNWTIFLV